MPEFQYQGVNKAGQKVTGKLEAPTEGELRMMLRAQGVRPTKIGKVGVLNADIGSMLGGGSGISSELLVGFTRQFQVLIGSGVPLVQALEVLANQSENRVLKNTLHAIREKVSGGSFFWEAISAYPKIFPKIYVALIRAGESSGALDAMLKRLTRYLEDAERLRKMLNSAMIYPVAVVVIAFGVVGAMLVFVIPKFEELLTGSGQDLPGLTQFVIDLSHWTVDNILFILGAIGISVFIGYRYKSSAEGRATIDQLVFQMPLFGQIAQKGAVARFSRTMGTLLSSGVNLLDAIDICKMTVDNSVIESAIGKIRGEVESGKTLGSVVSKLKVFPQMAVQMISVGESTGALDKMLDKVADFYEQEVENLVGSMTKLIEPIMLVVLGGLVAGIMLAMYLPIFKLAGSAGA